MTAGYDPREERYAWAWGRGPVAALAVAPETIQTTDTVTDLRRALEAPFDSAAERVLSAPGAPMVERLRSQVEPAAKLRFGPLPPRDTVRSDGTSAEETGSERGWAELWTTAVGIPTGQEPPVASAGDGYSLRPGDRLVYWDDQPPAAPLSAERGALAAGRCQVVLRQSSGAVSDSRADGDIVCYDLAGGTRTAVTADDLGAMYEHAVGEGVAFRLLARDCFVDPIGTERTYSVHVYAVDGAKEGALLLAGTRHDTATPRLEHPLALSTRVYEDAETLTAALRGSIPLEHPLSEWADEHHSVGALLERIAGQVERSARTRSISR